MKTKLLFCAILLSALSHAQTYSNNTLTNIPDGVNVTGGCGSNTTAGTVTVSIPVPLVATIADPSKVTINLDMTHPWLGDIVAELILPSATSGCALVKRVGAAADTACGSQGDFVPGNVLSFNSANATFIPVSGNPATGNYAPTGPTPPSTYPVTIPVCNLATLLNGVPVNGTWSLKMYDNGAGDFGSLNSWSIVFTAGFELSAQEFIYNYSVSVLGNPFENELVLSVNDPNAKLAKLNLYSMDGKLVYEKEIPTVNVTENIRIDTSAFTQGVYVLIPEIDGRKQNAIKVVKR